MAFLRLMADEYPEYVDLGSIGKSYESREIRYVKVKTIFAVLFVEGEMKTKKEWKLWTDM